MRCLFCGLLGLLFFSLNDPVAGQAVEVWGVDVVEHGIYITQEGQVEEGEHLLADRQRLVADMAFLEETFKIPAELGTRFGFRYVINGSPRGAMVPIRIGRLHPGLKDPTKDQTVYRHEDTREHEIGKVYGAGYGFDHDWELVSGRWTFEISYEENVLAEISFEIYKP